MDYSKYFHTEYDETAPIGKIGRGAHYSVLSALQARDEHLNVLDTPKIQRIGLIWDEDHDTRIIEVLEDALVSGILSPVKFIGERKGGVTIIVDEDNPQAKTPEFHRKWESICSSVDGDFWSFNIKTIVTDTGYIIHTSNQLIRTYLTNINNLWSIGLHDYYYASLVPKMDFE
ncbi:hypothetical protein QN400_07210 [Pseudomonas sp. RTC3]|uniref:hypothetical protein n=1 Tax=Pseudomonas sp. 5C2 TaxID=3048588 RepID=UPI002AB45BD3|nr:hypothetical protein [Pseudomonas sp. 5C2]MDY7566841.1 hypothetical protein [Pseudomonas sp. 5C2]MEB0061809.1 hypothetical protein [Pseudomonas sp. RTC3]MEB0239718.1 hypothetical protein [Pseudomonas sp. 5C2]